VQHNEYIFCISIILFFHPCHLYMSSIMLSVRPLGWKIANATPYFPSFTHGKWRLPDRDFRT